MKYLKLTIACFLCLTTCSPEKTTIAERSNEPSEFENTDGVLVPNLRSLEEKISRAQQGLPVDFDGDGFPEFMKAIDSAGVEYIEMTDEAGNVFYYSEEHPGEKIHILKDSNGDGMTDIQVDRTIHPSKDIWLRDRDYDGYPEERLTITYDIDAKQSYSLLERDLDGDEIYEITIEGTQSLEHSSLKKNISKTRTSGFNDVPAIQVLYENCATEQNTAVQNGEKIVNAINCAFNHGLNCLKRTNKSIYADAISFIGKGNKLIVKCDSSLKTPAQTSWYPFGFWPEEIIFGNSHAFRECSPGDANCLREEESLLCNLMIHEYLHVVGFGRESTSHDMGVDEVYSCGRFCGLCSNALQGAPGFPNRDCARCAGTLEEKLQCGHVEKIISGPCQNTYSICHQGLGCISAPCDKCTELYGYTCEEEISDDMSYPSFIYMRSDFLCCSECPETCNGSNDFPCGESLEPEDTCLQELPMCSK